MINRDVNKSELVVPKISGAVLVFLAGLGISAAEAGFRSPESMTLIQPSDFASEIAPRNAGTPCGTGL
jgi:hypothetical protein